MYGENAMFTAMERDEELRECFESWTSVPLNVIHKYARRCVSKEESQLLYSFYIYTIIVSKQILDHITEMLIGNSTTVPFQTVNVSGDVGIAFTLLRCQNGLSVWWLKYCRATATIVLRAVQAELFDHIFIFGASQHLHIAKCVRHGGQERHVCTVRRSTDKILGCENTAEGHNIGT
ncbi:Neuromedin-S [Frankliniella fusca]|uniref:Neuromedin-S n=1 Tax=Frankliniella fusca TaxID=407009 RepID=A0AAE1HE78_9NEOP|nr:Neuromedin-S [Frankliniella fusca]